MFEELCTAYQWKEGRWFEQAEQKGAEHNRKTMEGAYRLNLLLVRVGIPEFIKNTETLKVGKWKF